MLTLLPKAGLHATDILTSVLGEIESCRNQLLVAASCDNDTLIGASIGVLDVLDNMLIYLDNEGIISLGSRVIE